jgi:hypothetical protein
MASKREIERFDSPHVLAGTLYGRQGKRPVVGEVFRRLVKVGWRQEQCWFDTLEQAHQRGHFDTCVGGTEVTRKKL